MGELIVTTMQLVGNSLQQPGQLEASNQLQINFTYSKHNSC
jgi:hypothetical protein